MLYFSMKILAAIAAALVLLYLARRYLRQNNVKERFVRSLPGNMVQEIADRLGEGSAVEKYLEEFFQQAYKGECKVITDRTAFENELTLLSVPDEEKTDLLRVINAIDENDLLAYALDPEQGKAPVILALCRACGEASGVELHIFRSGETSEKTDRT